MNMNKPAAFLLGLLAFPALLSANELPESVADGTVMREGAVFPAYQVDGKSFYNGSWFDAIPVEDRVWRGRSDEQWRAVMEDVVVNSYGYADLDEWAQQWYGADSFDEVLGWYGGDYAQMAQWDLGIPSFPNLVTDAEKAGFIEDLSAGLIPGIYENVMYMGNPIFGSPRDDLFAIKAISSYVEAGIPSDSDFAALVQSASPLGSPLALNLSSGSLENTYLESTDLSLANVAIEELNGVSMWNVSLAGRDLTGWAPTVWSGALNLTGVTNLDPASLDSIDLGSGIYTNLNLLGLNLAGRNLSGANFTNVTGLSGADFASAGSISSTNLTGVNMAGFSGVGKDLYGVVFGAGNGITGADLNGATRYYRTNFGTVDMTGFSATGKDVSYANFSGATNFDGAMVNGASTYRDTNFTGVDMAGFDSGGASLYRANLTNATNLTPAMLAASTDFRSSNVTGAGMSKAALITALAAVGKPASLANNVIGLLP